MPLPQSGRTFGFSTKEQTAFLLSTIETQTITEIQLSRLITGFTPSSPSHLPLLLRRFSPTKSKSFTLEHHQALGTVPCFPVGGAVMTRRDIYHVVGRHLFVEIHSLFTTKHRQSLVFLGYITMGTMNVCAEPSRRR